MTGTIGCDDHDACQQGPCKHPYTCACNNPDPALCAYACHCLGDVYTCRCLCDCDCHGLEVGAKWSPGGGVGG